MKKILFLSFLFTLLGIVKMSAQSNTAPVETAKVKKDKTERAQHAEERSNGHAFSGKGHGNGKGKGKGHAKGHGKDKGKQKERKSEPGFGPEREEGVNRQPETSPAPVPGRKTPTRAPEMPEVKEEGGTQKETQGRPQSDKRKVLETAKTRKPKTTPGEARKTERKVSSPAQQR